jgi:uncharacterized protein DUF2637
MTGRFETGVSATPDATETTLDPDRLVRWSSILVVVLVALGAAFVSYRHAFELVHSHGEDGLAAAIGPATVDGMIYASGMVLLQAARYRLRPPRLAHAGLWLGIAATVGANVAHGIGHGPIGALVSAWPAVALIVSYELLMRLIRTGAAKGAALASDQPDATADQCPHGVAQSAEDAVRIAHLHARDCLGTRLSQRHLADVFKVDRKRVAALVADAVPAAPPMEAVSPNGQQPGAA